MIPSRRSLLSRLLRTGAFIGAALTVGMAAAQTGKPIRILVGFPPGGGSDAIARTLSEKLKDELGQPVVVENRPGAGGQVAAQALKASAPDGTTLFLTHDHTISILPQVVKNPGFEPARDFGRETGAVQTGPVKLDRSPLPRIHDPAHPLADADGFHDGSTVDLIVEVADAREASRSYEANLRVFEQSRQMSASLLDLLRR